MSLTSVNEIIVSPLKEISVRGGNVLHGLCKNDQGFMGFGEAYFSLIEYGAVKGWKRHLEMTMNLIVPHGDVEFFFYDDGNQRRSENLNLKNYVRLTVPPKIWFAFRGLADPVSVVVNISNFPHSTSEVERKDLLSKPLF